MAGKKTRKDKEKEYKNQVRSGGMMKGEGRAFSLRGIFRFLVIFIIGLLFWYASYRHVSYMFESDRHFSHLADFEREMTYRTEMGLYYSYYKTLINAVKFSDGLNEITRDNFTEYGHTINTLKRFNLYPEVILAFLYRNFKDLEKQYGWKTEQCWQVNRGDDLPPIQSCEGIGNPHYFYVNHAFGLASSVAASVFWLGVLVRVCSDSVFGGFISVLAFFFNHGEATRVQWTPPLRESFGYPVFLFQMLITSYILKRNKTGVFWGLLNAIATVFFLLFWQFAQFALATQIGALFLLYILDILCHKSLKTLLFSHLLALGSSYFLLFGNEMLLTSIYFSAITTTWVLLAINERLLRNLKFRLIFLLLNGAAFVGCVFWQKKAIGKLLDIQDDAHIFDILKAKFTDFANFHTRMYTCAPEFDFLGYEMPQKLLMTLLLPSAVLGAILLLLFLVRYEFWNILWKSDGQSALGNRVFVELTYNLIQMGCFAAMAVLIMRLKLFFTPHLCIAAAFLANRRLLNSVLRSLSITPLVHTSILVGLMGAMAYQGHLNLKSQWQIQGEYSNPPQEALFEWIVEETPEGSVFAGTMPLMANLKLSTNRPIVNHPHYEDAGLRNRTVKVYSVYSRKSGQEVHEILRQLKVNYFVFEYSWCGHNAQRPECSYPAMYDLIDPKNKGKKPLCERIHEAQGEKIGPFKIVYNFEGYKVLKVQ